MASESSWKSLLIRIQCHVCIISRFASDLLNILEGGVAYLSSFKFLVIIHLFLVLNILEQHVNQTESAQHKDNEKEHNFEGKVPLILKLVPVLRYLF